jgi:hypothetical protein
MAIRRRELHPDETFQTRSGRQIPVVSEEQYLAQLVDLGRWQMFAGGAISVVVFRASTDLDGEQVTVGGVLEWKSATYSKQVDADPETQPQPMTYGEAVEATGGPLELSAMAREQAERQWSEAVEAVENGAEIRVEAGSLAPEVVHEEESAPRAAEPAPPASSDGIADGLEDIDPNAEDVSEIPEHLRA